MSEATSNVVDVNELPRPAAGTQGVPVPKVEVEDESEVVEVEEYKPKLTRTKLSDEQKKFQISYMPMILLQVCSIVMTLRMVLSSFQQTID